MSMWVLPAVTHRPSQRGTDVIVCFVPPLACCEEILVVLVGGREGLRRRHDRERRPVPAAERSRLRDEHRGRADEREGCNDGKTTTPIECHDNSCFRADNSRTAQIIVLRTAPVKRPHERYARHQRVVMRPVSYTWDNAMVEGRRRLALLEHSLDIHPRSADSKALVSRRDGDVSMSELAVGLFVNGCVDAWRPLVMSRQSSSTPDSSGRVRSHANFAPRL